MSAQPTPIPWDTQHVATDGMYPAIMDKLAQLADQVRALGLEVRALRVDVAALRVEQRVLRWGAIGCVAIVVLGAAGAALVAWLR